MSTHSKPRVSNSKGRGVPEKQQLSKKSKNKSTAAKAKGKSQPSSAASKGDNDAPPQEKEDFKPEPAGEDDHAFFDDEENEGYANFMLSLQESELPTFSKRSKDRVAVAPTRKKKTNNRPTPASSLEEQVTVLARPQAAEVAAAATKDTPVARTVSFPVAKREEVVVDAKRRKASTAGWVEDDTGPPRLPIKTRRGILKPNERMDKKASAAEPEAATAVAGGDTANANGSTVGAEGDRMDVDDDHEGGINGAENGRLPEDVVGDMSDSSVYDAADSDAGRNCSGSPEDAAAGRAAGGGGRTGVDLAVLRQRRFLQKKAIMAELCESIVGAPEESLMRPKIVAKGEDDRSRMEQLFSLVRLNVNRTQDRGCEPVIGSFG